MSGALPRADDPFYAVSAYPQAIFPHRIPLFVLRSALAHFKAWLLTGAAPHLIEDKPMTRDELLRDARVAEVQLIAEGEIAE